MAQSTCTADNCEKPHRARGLCGSHYNQTHQPNRHAKVEVACTHCGEPCLKERASRRPKQYCSLTCRDEDVYAQARAARRQVAIAPAKTMLEHALTAVSRRTAKPIAPRTWVAGQCRMCGRGFICKWGSSTCSAPCQDAWYAQQKRAHRSKRRATKKDAFVANVYPSRVYARDLYTCRLCDLPLDMSARVPAPLAPTVDHVVPLARGGKHHPENVQAAHFLCNARKGASLDWRAA